MFNTLTGKLITTFAISMVPVVELRGAIPYGVALGLNPLQAYIVSVLGNMVPVPLILLSIERIFKYLKSYEWWAPKIAWLENRAESKGDMVRKYRMIGLLILVAIPLPGTGAWTGALVAALMELRLRHAFPVIFAGVLIAGALVLAITGGVSVIVA